MRTRFILVLTVMVLLSGCYCKWVKRGYSSVRELKAIHDYKICPDDATGGKTIPLTIYSGDPFFSSQNFSRNDTLHSINQIKYEFHPLIGIRGETFIKLGSYPGPFLGVGLDYNRNTFTAEYLTVIHQLHEKQIQNIQQQRLNLSLNLVTWLKSRMMGYLSYQRGKEWTKREIQSNFTQYNYSDKKFYAQKNFRIAYGFLFFFRPGIAFNLELGYGSGTFLKAGITAWVF